MLVIPKAVFDQIIAHASADLPNEACGYLAGVNNDVSVAYELTNVDQSVDHFSFDPAEQFKTVKDARSKDLEIIANYHSHPSSPARPSVEDIRLAFDPSMSYVIVSLMTFVPVVKSFKIKDGIVSPEEIIVR